MPYQVRMRVDAQPVSRPACTGELANTASSVGPSSCTAAHRSARPPGGPASRLGRSPAVLHIIVRPSLLRRAKDAAIAW